jgi:hypothetical protein
MQSAHVSTGRNSGGFVDDSQERLDLKSKRLRLSLRAKSSCAYAPNSRRGKYFRFFLLKAQYSTQHDVGGWTLCALAVRIVSLSEG